MPDLRQLRTFVAVAEELNFTRAAERLFVAQQAVSRSVAGLERELGVALFNRTTHIVTLTAAGAALLESGRNVIAAAERAFSAGDSAVAVEMSERVDLPLLVIWLPGASTSAVRRLREGMAESG